MRNNFSKGFTLIELLVVIAIIGILSSVVLSSLNTARSRGANAAVKNNLANLRSQAELFYEDTSSTYSGLCADTKFRQGIDAAHSASGSTLGVVVVAATAQTGTPPNSTTNCRANASSWSVSTPLRVSEVVSGVTRNYWCVDSTGFSGARANVSGTGTPYACPAS